MPQQPVDEHGECRHLYLTGDATCVHCGMQFKLAWSAERNWLLWPLFRNGGFGVFFTLILVATQASGFPLLPSAALVGSVLFFTRAFLGVVETMMRHGFVPGRLGPLLKRQPFNPLPPKPAVTVVGRVRFPIDRQTYEQFAPGDTLLVEHLRWSRLPVAIYRGQLP